MQKELHQNIVVLVKSGRFSSIASMPQFIRLCLRFASTCILLVFTWFLMKVCMH